MDYTVGLIGTGGIAARHAAAYDKTNGIEIVAAADPEPAALTTFGETWNVPQHSRYADHQAMLAAEQFDAISICSPTRFHFRHTIDAARSEAEPDVIFCEKPIATNVSDATSMIEVCDDAGVELLIDHTRRFHPHVQSLRDYIVEDDALGDVISVNVGWSGELLRNGPHPIDLVLFFLETTGSGVAGGHLREHSQSASKYDDTGGAGILHLADGILVTFDITRTRQQPAKVTEFVGTEGRLHVDWWNDELRYWECTDSLVSPKPEARESLYGDYLEESIQQLESFSTKSEVSLEKATVHVRNLIEGTVENISPGRNARDVLELLVGVYVSAYGNGTHVELPLDRPLRDVTVSLA